MSVQADPMCLQAQGVSGVKAQREAVYRHYNNKHKETMDGNTQGRDDRAVL
jgi:hypothetical protein